MSKQKGPRILLIDIETSPLEVYAWQLFDQNIALNQIIKDWSILSYAAKWLDSDKIMYEDTRNKKDVRDDKSLVANICKLLDQCDVVVSHYGKKFDIPKIDTRRLKHKLPMFTMPKHEDTKFMASKFSFTSNKLEYVAKFLGTKYQKLTTKRKFSGMDLWRACLNKNVEGWKEMEKYNKLDILTLQGVYEQLKPRASKLNSNLWNDGEDNVCSCGSSNFRNKGYHYTEIGKFTRFQCKSCGKNTRGKTNLFSLDKRKSIKINL